MVGVSRRLAAFRRREPSGCRGRFWGVVPRINDDMDPACASCKQSPPIQLVGDAGIEPIERADKECNTINDRFAKDLAHSYTTVGTVGEDKKKIGKRVALIEDLQRLRDGRSTRLRSPVAQLR